MTKRKLINSPARFAALILILLAVATVSLLSYYNSSLKAVTEESEEQMFTVAKGSSVKTIAASLENQGLIRNAQVFIFYSRFSEKANKIKAGDYTISGSMSVAEIVDKLAAGDAKKDTVKFTIPEGFELRQIADRLEAEGLINKEQFYEAASKAASELDFVKAAPNRENKLEGYLFPDTYEVFKNASEEDIINKMLNRFNQVFTEEYQNRAKELDMSIDEVITLASIIEREAKLDKERKTVSAVFHNRLKQKMKLESCATVQYLLKEQKPVLTFKDLKIDSPYNTYIYAGLPEGPIASPGAKSIEAALYPEDVDYLFFVANNDGSHVFTKTYREHLNAQNKIRQ